MDIQEEETQNDNLCAHCLLMNAEEITENFGNPKHSCTSLSKGLSQTLIK